MRHSLLPLALFCSAQLFAQTDLLPYTKFPQASYFRERFSAPTPPRVELQPPLRLSDFVVDGKLELSLRSYLDLVLSNNTDIALTRLSIEQPRNAITAAYGRFDPFLTMDFRPRRSVSPTTDALAGAAIASNLSQPLSFNYTQVLESGTEYTVGFGGTRSSNNSAFTNVNPAFNTSFQFSFAQPLLRDRGGYVNKLNIMVARSRFRQSEYNMQDQLMRILQMAENAYWAVVEARESLKVQEQGLALQDESLKRSQRELELGAISPLEIYRPQQSYATQEVTVTQARYRLQQQEDALRRQMGADLDPQYRNMAIVLTETTLPPTDEKPLDKELYVETAFQKRPDLKSQLQAIDINDLQHRSAKNRLLPALALTGAYASQGVGGNVFERTDVFTGDGTRSQVINMIPGGLGDSLSQVFHFNFPIYSVGINLRLPIRDRATTAELANAVVNKRIEALRARQIEQQIRLEVLNAVTQVESARAAVKLAQVALDFSQKNREAEQKRYDLGVTTLFFLLDAQQQETRAQAALVTESVNYRRALLGLLRASGQLLEERGVQIQ
jgi:outer membrane protein TolC